jgi:NIMA (never in mitosis gene a)-related kinase
MKDFDIIKKLGEGAYSTVYKVRRRADNKVYALKKVKMKTLNDKEKKNSLNEVRILASIKSPFVISYKEAFISEEDSCLCLVMEYADKGDLYQKITAFKNKKQLFEEIDIWKIFIQITRGLKPLHDLKILHRDFKSANIFLFGDGTAKIGDLNVSKVIRNGLGYTQTGTPYYASPEVWNNDSYDEKSDIWSLACITYEMITLNPPFRAQSFEGLYQKVISGKYAKISNKYSTDLSDLLKILFRVNPKERPTCAEILKHPLIQKRIEYFKAQIGLDCGNIDAMDDNILLKTIRLQKNLLGLAEKLPKPNYIFPEINKSNNNNNNKNNINRVANKTLPSIHCIKTSYNSNNNTNNFKINKKLFSLNKKLLTNGLNQNNQQNQTYKAYNIFTSPGKKTSRKTIMEGRKNCIIVNNSSNDIKKKNERRLNEAYRLYVSNDSKRILGKKKYLPKLFKPRTISKSPKK